MDAGAANRHAARSPAGARSFAVGGILGFVGMVALVAIDAAPVVEFANRLPVGVAGLLIVGALAGGLANDRRTWSGLLAGILAAAALYLAARAAFVSMVGPSVAPVDVWRSWLWGALLASIGLASIGFVIGRVLRGWRLAGLAGGIALGLAWAVACFLAAGAIAFAASQTGLVLTTDLPILTVRVTDSGIELSPERVDRGPYVIISESNASRARMVSTASAHVPSAPNYADVFGMPPEDVGQVLEGAWLRGDPRTPPPYVVGELSTIEPGERRYHGEWTFNDSAGPAVLFYASEPGSAVVARRPDIFDPGTGQWSESGEGCCELHVPWPPEHWATLTVRQ